MLIALCQIKSKHLRLVSKIFDPILFVFFTFLTQSQSLPTVFKSLSPLVSKSLSHSSLTLTLSTDTITHAVPFIQNQHPDSF